MQYISESIDANKATRDLLRKYFEIPGKKSIRDDGRVDVVGDCTALVSEDLKKLPIRFGSISRNFNCQGLGLTSLDGSPDIVSGAFNCSQNNLTSLIGGPKEVENYYFCNNNKLTSLEGMATTIGGSVYCAGNPLISLNGLNGTYSVNLEWQINLPLLRLLKYKWPSVRGNASVQIILSKYCGDKFSRSSVLQCQKELIRKGFEGNASW
jgi:hypothetical protein